MSVFEVNAMNTVENNRIRFYNATLIFFPQKVTALCDRILAPHCLTKYLSKIKQIKENYIRKKLSVELVHY